MDASPGSTLPPPRHVDDTLMNVGEIGLHGNGNNNVHVEDGIPGLLPAPDLQEAGVNARSVSPGEMSVHSQDSCHASIDGSTSFMSPIEKADLEVIVKPAPEFRRSTSLNASVGPHAMPIYRMESVPRGFALIVEIEAYDNEVHETRVGSEHDRRNLASLFKQLFFNVVVKRNLTKLQFMKELDEIAKDGRQVEADMFILVVLSHGRDGCIITSDGRQIATEAIYERFNNQRCPNLAGKPKFFIVQACRGDETDTVCHGVGDLDMEMETLNPKKRRADGLSSHDTVPYGLREVDRARPTWEDMIIAYSTIPGFASMRDHDRGTWFIQSLVEVFMNHAHSYELIDLLRMTSEYLSRFTNKEREKQTCNIEMRHLYKRIYFNPGLPMAPTSGTNLRRTRSTPTATPPSSPRHFGAVRKRRPESDSEDEITM